MLEEDRSPIAPKPVALDGLSIEDLEDRLVRLRQEAAECERLIAMKRSVREAADQLFRSGAA